MPFPFTRDAIPTIADIVAAAFLTLFFTGLACVAAVFT
jgi:hypothetical protein